MRRLTEQPAPETALALPSIRADVGVSASEYAVLYAPMMAHTASALGDIEPLLQRVRLAIRARQGAMLPAGAKPEDIALMGGAMTYALVAAMLLEASCDNEPPGRPLLDWQRVIPEGGIAWITQYPPVLAAFIGYFTTPKTSSLRTLNNPDQRSKGAQFLDWLQAHPEHAMVTDDHALFVPYPAAFTAYAQATGIAEKTALNQVLRLKYHRMTPDKKNRFSGSLPGQAPTTGILFERGIKDITQVCQNRHFTLH